MTKTGLKSLFDKVAANSSSRVLATESLVMRMLSSVRFLYRTEVGVRDGKESKLDAFERAAVISYAVTGSMPDSQLFADAGKGPAR